MAVPAHGKNASRAAVVAHKNCSNQVYHASKLEKQAREAEGKCMELWTAVQQAEAELWR